MNRIRIKKTVVVCLLGGLLCMGTTTAYFSDHEETVNILVPGHNTTEVEEVFPSPPPQNPDLNPNYEKTVWVSNAGGTNSECSVPCYTRISLSYSHSDISKALYFKNLNTTDWIYNSQDGFYYYRYVLQKGEKTKPLFTGFYIDSAKVEDKYKKQIPFFSIHVYEESVQANGFPDYHSAWRYYENPIKDS